ncbi:MAG: hypothetical protein ACOY3I_00930 [Verrucomicrobiota bacterium]
MKPIFLVMLAVGCVNVFTLPLLGKTHSFNVLPSGDLRHKTEEQSEKDLQRYVNKLSTKGREHCSRGVREAIRAEYGIDIFKSARPGDLIMRHGRFDANIQGLDYMLKANGYEVVPPENYIPQKGDIQGIVYMKKKYAHAQYFDGIQWVSDHVQPASGADPSLLQKGGMTTNDIFTITYRRKK